jgi:hypothetical protein
MKVSFLLHFYQPHNQQKDILDRIVRESYLPLTRGLLQNERFRVVVNMNGALVDLLHETGHEEVLDNFRKLYQRGQIELTSSAKYHAFLPLIEEDEVKRQIIINNQTLEEVFGQSFQAQGFFPPEMSVNSHVLKIVSDSGFKWTCAAQLAKEDGTTPSKKVLYQDKDSGLYIFFRNKRVSSLILSAVCRNAQDLIKETQDIHDDEYWFCVMDAETFGHHRIGHEKMLFDILGNQFFEPVLAADLLKSGLPVGKTAIRPSTWTNEEQDFWLDKEKTQPTEAKSFILWNDPENPIHKEQWDLTKLAIKTVHDAAGKGEASENYREARKMLDFALASDQYWWASAKPWWSLEMIEQGAFQLKSVIEKIGNKKDRERGEELYRAILDQAFEWQRSGEIRQKHLDNSDTFMKKPFKERTNPEWYNQIILEFEDEMKKAAAKQEFEKAVKWRDAVLKLKQGIDNLDVLHVVNELWTARNIPEVKPFLSHDWEEFSQFAKDNFVDVRSKEEFEAWKKRKEEKK